MFWATRATLMWLLYFVFLPIVWVIQRSRRLSGKAPSPRLAIEAGVKGWELIEFKELLSSAEEFLPSLVSPVKIENQDSILGYVREVTRAVKREGVSHYHYDPRTGPQGFTSAVATSVLLAVYFSWARVVPICKLTDFGVFMHRWQVAIVSAASGVVLSLQAPASFSRVFPHTRIFGPFPMAFSSASAEKIIEASSGWARKRRGLGFVGRLNYPRSRILNQVEQGLNLSIVPVEMQLQVSDENSRQRLPESTYWQELGSTQFGLTTTAHTEAEYVDLADSNHLVYRVFEIPLTGSLLVAQETSGFRRFFRPEVDSIWFNNPSQVGNQLEGLLREPDHLQRIAERGRQRVLSLARAGVYWLLVDTVLGRESIY